MKKDTLFQMDGQVANFDPLTGSGKVVVGGKEFEFSSRCFYPARHQRAPERGEDVTVFFSPSPDLLLSVRAKR